MRDAIGHASTGTGQVSGYLHGTASMAGHGSTHAWTEVYLPTLGWRGFDPTRGERVSTRHVVTGVSNHPRGVMPVSGTFTREAGDCTGPTCDSGRASCDARSMAGESVLALDQANCYV
jgi:hypothetical protein